MEIAVFFKGFEFVFLYKQTMSSSQICNYLIQRGYILLKTKHKKYMILLMTYYYNSDSIY